ncbi:hypothetical protein SAMN02990966_02201 [Rhodospirillales bacterium URHD0017]|nr:hypothetical protein SAMN02990966_02201 [Rhodospirillales bacterium URHD0017]
MSAAPPTNGHGIKVALAAVPQLLASVVRQAVEAERDMAIVAEVESSSGLADALTDRVDVIITARKGEELALPFRAALFGHRSIPIVAIGVDGTSIEIYSHSITRGYGLAGLIGLIREAVAESQPRTGG